MLVTLVVLLAVGFGIYIYSGSYPVGADVPHSGLVFSLLETVRDRGIEVQSRHVRPPLHLNTRQRLLIGAGHYSAMCSRCHLAPGFETDATREGLYPKPPRLARGTDLTPAEIYWVIKHGLKFSGMPAWGQSHTNSEIWDITAFVLALPHLTPLQYQDWVAQAPSDPDRVRLPMPGGGPLEQGRTSSPATEPAPQNNPAR